MSILFRDFLQQFPLYFSPDAPTGNSGSSSEGKETNSQDILELLDAEEETETIPLEDKSTKEIKGKEKEEDDEDEKEEIDDLDELEEELEGPDEDKLELVTPVRRKEILSKYPKLFKDFPYLERAYYREQQFTELFSTIDDAKKAAERADTLSKFEKDLSTGNLENILKATKEEHPNAFNKVVDDYLEVLYKIDKDAQHHVIGRIVQQTVQAMVNEASESEEKVGAALKSAAHILHQFVFGTSKFKPIEPLHDPKGTDKKESQVDEREQQFRQRKFDSTSNELSTKIENILTGTIKKYIDPKDSMSEYVKGHASADAMKSLESLIEKDGRFQKILDKLWERAIEADFDTDSVNKIRSAYISKARTLLPSVIKKARIDALKGIGKRVQEDVTEDDEHEEEIPRKKKEGRSTSSSNRGRGEKEQKRNPSEGKSTYDYLMED